MNKTIRYAVFGALMTVSLMSYGQLSKTEKALGKVDSTLNLDLPRITDSLSIEELNRVDSVVNRIEKKIDSLQTLRLPTEKYQRKLDSISSSLRKRLDIQAQADSLTGKWMKRFQGTMSARDSLHLQLTKHADRLQQKIKAKTSFIDSVSLKIKDPLSGKTMGLDGNLSEEINKALPGQLSLPASGTGMPNAGGLNLTQPVPKDLIPDMVVPNTNQGANLPKVETPSIGNEIKQIQNVPGQELNKVGLQDVKSIQDEASKVKEVTNEVKRVQKDISRIKEGNLDSLQSFSGEVERAAMNVDELKQLKTETAKAENARNMLQQYQAMMSEMNKETIKEKSKDVAQQEVRDQFAGQEEKLKAGISQLDQLKKKYGTIPDSRYLPKRAPNCMKALSFRERFVPGLAIQVFATSVVALDLQPYVAYKLSGRFRPGIGGSYRIEASSGSVRSAGVFSLRAFNDLRLLGTMYFHLEGEWSHYSQEALQKFTYPADENMNEWKTRVNAGIMKAYTISKRFDGQAQLLYNVADLSRFPSTGNTSLRFGFEYKFKLKK